nr:hypothetical protein [Bacteroidota bacterium]
MKKVTFELIRIEALIFDCKSSRLPETLNDKSETEIINFFLSDASLVELMLAIGKNDFFEGEQLLVVANGDKY